jgi:hypothetical protein
MPTRAAKFKKNTRRRGQKSSRKQTRKMRKMRGGNSGAVGGKYTFTVKTPIAPGSIVTGFPAALGTLIVTPQQIAFNNSPSSTKQIQNIRILNGTTPYMSVGTYSTPNLSKVSIKIEDRVKGTKSNLVPTGVVLNGTEQLPGRSGPLSGVVTIKGLGGSSFGVMPPTLTFEVTTAN